ncbi:MAG: ECF transporter S component [Halodesulfurarchaeum sp.]|nr:ECF transporter S component [Halodesulfurarchaeum sp.]
MKSKDRFDLDASTVAFSAVIGAAVAVATLFTRIPVGIGYLNFGEVFIYTGAFLFGGTVGGLAGGIGAAAADVISGYVFFAPVTLVAKGIEGYVVGEVAGDSLRSKAIAVALGAPFMIVAYVLAVAYLEGLPLALAKELPVDILQAVVGFAIAVPLSKLLEDRVPELR